MRHSVTEHTLATGTKGLLIDVPGSEVVNILIRFNSGAQFSPKGKYEVSHFVEHLIANGNEDYPRPGDFKIEIAKNGASRSAHTDERVNGYFVECAAFELPRILGLLVGYLGKPLFPVETFTTELNNVREELNFRTTEHARICVLNLLEALWPGEFVGYDKRISQLERITIEDVRDFYRRTHTANNMRFYIAGSLAGKEELILGRLTDLTSLLDSGERLVPSTEVAKRLTSPLHDEHKLKSIYYDIMSTTDEMSIEERRAASLMRVLLFGNYQGRISGPMRTRGLAYAIDAHVGGQPGRSEFGVLGFVTDATIKPLFELIASEIKRLKSGELMDNELDAARNLLLGSNLRSRQTSVDMLSWYAGTYDIWGVIRDFDTDLASYADITVDQVIAITKKLTDTDRSEVSFLGPVSAAQAKQYRAYLEPIWDQNH